MATLEYSVFQYSTKKETINLGVIFYCRELDMGECYFDPDFDYLAKADPGLNMVFFNNLISDIAFDFMDKTGGSPFNLKKFCNEYHEEFHFSEIETMAVINRDDCIEKIKIMKVNLFRNGG